MKKINLLFAVLAIFALGSCVNEEEFGKGVDLSSKDIAFVFGGTTTRSAASASSMDDESGVSISLGTESGMEIFMKETVTDLNATGLATRGTPIYDENITTIKDYQSFEAVAYVAGGAAYDDGTATFASMGYQKEVESRNGWVYKHHYDDELPWPDETTDLYFFLRMPTAFVDSLLYEADGKKISYNSTNGSITFNYQSPLTGEKQKDILFSSRTLNKKQYDKNYKETGAPVTMYHALTGVKFRTGNDNSSTTKTIITGVEISGLMSKGQCVVTPSASGDNIVVWDKNKLSENGVKYTMGFSNPDYDQTKDNTIDYSPEGGDKVGSFGNSWYAAADSSNLNDENGTKTFWFIPQEIPDNATLKVTFRVKTPDTPQGTEITHTISDFGKRLKKDPTSTTQVVWKAGQLRTYTLEPEDVDVEIFDHMEGLKKENLHVTNTGNVKEFVRMMVIGNWYDKDGHILVGYTSPDPDNNEMATPWFREDPEYGQYFDPTFKFARPANGNKWVRGTGSYYYYPYKIGPGTNLDSGTEALFQSYEIPADKVPTIYVPTTTSSTRVKAEGVHLVMEVVIQAIGAKKADGTEYKDSEVWDAWTNATGVTIKEKPFKDNNTSGDDTQENTEG